MRRASLDTALFIGAVLWAAPLLAGEGAGKLHLTHQARAADVVFLGEQHDNPSHHETQAAWVQALEPRALVFEMLTVQQARAVTGQNRVSEDSLEAALGWNASGWPEFSMYFPIFAAAPEAAIYGAAVPRDRLRSVMDTDLVEVIGVETAQRFGLDQPLPAEQQKQREDLQRIAHCDALPAELLPRMVSVQRVRDAVLAKAALEALAAHGGPVVVITGNGHARTDWAAPFLLQFAAPEVSYFALGQSEPGQDPGGGFSVIAEGSAVDRGDPCDVFK